MLGAIRSKRAVTPEGIRPATIVFENERIVAIDSYATETDQAATLDIGDHYVLPGLVDTHIHVNEPGRTEWEGFATASRAAAAGGYTCFVDMPLNSIPATTDVPGLQSKREAAARNSLVDFAFWGGAVAGNADRLSALAEAGVKGFKCFTVESGVPEFAYVRESDLRAGMPIIADSGLPLLAHAEDPEIIANATQFAAGEDPKEYASYLASRPQDAEVAAIKSIISLCREHKCRVHIVHLSASDALALLEAARQEGLPVTVETCPHYLYFAAAQISRGATQFKCAPPIRDEENRERLWKALRQGSIDMVATDHSPCPPEMKQSGDGDFFRSWGGIASVSVALPAIWTAARKRGFTIVDVVRWMSAEPARLAGLSGRKGSLAAGCDADFFVFDPDSFFTVETTDLYFRHPLTPYLGERLQGRVLQTFVRGTSVYRAGSFNETHRGIECTVNE